MSEFDHTTNPPRKICTQCGRSLPATKEWFHKNRDGADKLCSICKACRNINNKIYKPTYNKLVYSVAPPPTKRCTRCLKVQDATTFYRCKFSPDGLESYCKECQKTRNAERRRNKGEQMRLSGQMRYWLVLRDDPGYMRAKIEQSKRYVETHRTSVQAQRQNWKRRHPDHQRNWIKTHPGHVKAHTMKRRAIKAEQPSDFTRNDWLRALEYWNDRCAVCGKPRGLWHTIAADHWIPVSDSRPDNPGTVPWNILPLCHARGGGEDCCNNSKHNRDPIEWLFDRLGPNRAKRKLNEIERFFEWVRRERQ